MQRMASPVSLLIRSYSSFGLSGVGLGLLLCCLSLFHSTDAISPEAGRLVEQDGRDVFVESMDQALKLLL